MDSNYRNFKERQRGNLFPDAPRNYAVQYLLAESASDSRKDVRNSEPNVGACECLAGASVSEGAVPVRAAWTMMSHLLLKLDEMLTME